MGNSPRDEDTRFDTPQGISAAVLTGGRSRRMGEPKAILTLAPDAPTLVEMVMATLREVASGVLLVGEPDWTIPASLRDLRIVRDGRQGAADGVIAALTAAAHDLCLVVGCDMPFLDSALLTDMVTAAHKDNRSVIARDDTGVHPLHAVYRRDDRARIAALVAGGERSLTRICSDIGALEVDIGSDEARWWSVFNVNTPADLAAAREHVAQHRSPEGETYS